MKIGTLLACGFLTLAAPSQEPPIVVEQIISRENPHFNVDATLSVGRDGKVYLSSGATDYYEGYLSVDAWEDDPVFIICTELPPGLKPEETLDVPVAFSGYFYKVFRYTAADTPIFLGRRKDLHAALADLG